MGEQQHNMSLAHHSLDHPNKVRITRKILPLIMAFNSFSFSGVYGGYRRDESASKLLYRTDFLWLKLSKENFPW